VSEKKLPPVYPLAWTTFGLPCCFW